jgi:hypothetical protein
MSAEPLIVAKAIEHAIRSKRPRTRYPLTAGARMMFLAARAAHPRLGRAHAHTDQAAEAVARSAQEAGHG